MKKRYLAIILTCVMALSLAACGSNPAPTSVPANEASSEVSASSENSTEATVGLPNPWEDITEEKADAMFPNLFKIPEGATNVQWSMLKAKDDTTLPGTMIQANFDLDGVSYVARMQPQAGEEIVDISGAYYEWTVTDEGTLSAWGNGNMNYASMRYIGEDETVDVCNWFDIETGYAYSLLAKAKDLDGFDIIAVVDSMYAPQKQFGANAPDEGEITLDITGCDTFTQIVDQKLSDGMGYANATISDIDVLLVCSGCYDDLEGHMASIDSAVFMYIDGVPTQIGTVYSGGTAYPISIYDGCIYTAGNHYVCKYSIIDNKLVLAESISELYDSDGNCTYYYNSADGQNNSDLDQEEISNLMSKYLTEMATGDIVSFTVVSK